MLTSWVVGTAAYLLVGIVFVLWLIYSPKFKDMPRPPIRPLVVCGFAWPVAIPVLMWIVFRLRRRQRS